MDYNTYGWGREQKKKLSNKLNTVVAWKKSSDGEQYNILMASLWFFLHNLQHNDIFIGFMLISSAVLNKTLRNCNSLK